MTTPDPADRLREIIRTQTAIAASDLEPLAIMQLIAERAQTLTRASAGVIELAEGEEMVYTVTTGEATTSARGCGSPPASPGAARWRGGSFAATTPASTRGSTRSTAAGSTPLR